MSLSFDPEALRVLAELINKTGLSEIELAEGDRKLRLARAIAPVNVPVVAAAMAPAVTRTWVIVPDLGALIWLKVFIASMSNRVAPASTVWPTAT